MTPPNFAQRHSRKGLRRADELSTSTDSDHPALRHRGATAMRAKTLLGRKTPPILLMGAVGLGLTGCFPDTGPPPADPTQNALYAALNRDRARVSLPPLTWSPKLAHNAGSWAWQMMAHNSLFHQNLGAVLYSSDYQAYS